jgi:hypothetical protein
LAIRVDYRPTDEPQFSGTSRTLQAGFGSFARLSWRESMGIERAQIEATFTKIREVNDGGDYNKFVDLFAEDGTFINSALPAPVQGREALRRLVAQWPKVENRPEWWAIDGNRLVFGWNERQEGMRADAPAYRGISTYVFDDNGLVRSYEGTFDTAALAAATAP